jgi:hypothetical protein
MKGGRRVLFRETGVSFTKEDYKAAFYASHPDKEGTCYQII